MKTVEEIQETMRLEQQVAAWRTLNIFTQWLKESEERYFLISLNEEKKFELYVRDGERGRFFYGETVQDAYAQAAQTISFNGGEL